MMKYFSRKQWVGQKGELFRKGGFFTLTWNFYEKTKILNTFHFFFKKIQNHMFLKHKISAPFSLVGPTTHFNIHIG